MYLFVYGNSKKKVEMDTEGSGANLDQIKAKAKEVFNIEDFIVQTWDRGFEEWVDLEEDEVVESNTKILLTEKVVSIPCHLSASTLTALSSSDTSSSSGELPSSGAASILSIPSTSSGEPSSPEPSTASGKSSPILGLSSPVESLEKTDPCWHLTYKLPTIPASIEAKLLNGEQLKEAERSSFLDAIYNSVKCYTYYPKTGQYDTIVQRILDKYPKMLSQQGMSCGNVKTLWKYRLQYKFSNCRKREDNNIAAVKMRKRKGGNIAVGQPAKKSAAPQWGMLNYLPQRPESEDDTSVDLHTTWMKNEVGKKKPNYSRIRDSMQATFADRRKKIVTDGASIAYLQEEYPWLFDEEELQHEFKRIDGTSSLLKKLEDGLDKYADAIIVCVKVLKKRPKMLEEALAEIPLQKEAAERKASGRRAAILAIPSLMQERVENVVIESEVNATDLHVFIDVKTKEDASQFDVMVDGVTVTSSSSFMEAFVNYLAAFYCFNLAYPTTLRKTLNFIQKVILNVQDNLPIDKTVVKVLDKLNRVMSGK